MTRWSFRRRRAVTPDAGRDYWPGPSAAPPAHQPTAGLAPGSGQRNGTWFEAGWDRSEPAGQGKSDDLAQPGATQHGVTQNGSGQYGSGQPGGALSGTGQYDTESQAAQQSGAYGARISPFRGRRVADGTVVLAPPPPPAPPAPAASAVPAVVPPGPAPGGWAAQQAGKVWQDICDQFGLHLLVLAEQLRTSLDELEADEGDPERLKRLYQVDHAVTRMRRASRDLRILSGRSEEELAGFTTSLLDVVRMAASAIERYTQLSIGRVTELAVLGYAADDVASALSALLDNATRYSPGTVTVSCHLLEDGGVMFRIEDTGIGVGAEQVTALNAVFAGPVPEADERTGRHTGFPVVHRVARKHSLGVRLAARPLPGSGTVAMVTLPPQLLCEVPAEEAQRRPAAVALAAQQAPRRPAAPDLPRGEGAADQAQPPPRWAPLELPARDAGGEQDRAGGDLPRRERASLRGDEPSSRAQAMVPTTEQRAAARRAFADDLSAFSLGTGGSAGPAGQRSAGRGAAGDDAETTAPTATEEQA
jgi:hypothetical protein